MERGNGMSKRIPKAPSEGEELFALHCRLNGLTPEREYAFCEGRKFRADFAFPRHKLLVEIEGGTWINGRHNRPSNFEAECRKYAEAAIREWLVIRVTTAMVKSGEAIDMVRRALA